ncbi:MAG: ComF family protein [Alphaproteobacteria bacterium]|nr:ComF family protein [Alphaproteobacteria bacterium]
MQRVLSHILSIGQHGIDAVLPPRCVVSGAEVDRQGVIAPDIWASLNFIAEPQCAACGGPFEFEIEAGGLCAPCLVERPVYETARAALKYDDYSRGLILGFKHGDRTQAAPAFVPWMKAAGHKMLAQAECLIPVPLHRGRLLARRYNQSALIAQALSKNTGIPTFVDALERVRATPPQGHMNIKDRRRNARKAFAVNPKRAGLIAGKTIVLIDDVYTTGATVQECTRILLKSGAQAVHVLTLARVVKS